MLETTYLRKETKMSSSKDLIRENLLLWKEVAVLRTQKIQYDKNVACLREEFQADAGRQAQDEIDTLKLQLTSLTDEISRLHKEVAKAQHSLEFAQSSCKEQLDLRVELQLRLNGSEKLVETLQKDKELLRSENTQMRKSIESLVQKNQAERGVETIRNEELEELRRRGDEAETLAASSLALQARLTKAEEDLKARKRQIKTEDVVLHRWTGILEQAITLFSNVLVRPNSDPSEMTEQLSKCRGQTARFREGIVRERTQLEQEHGAASRTPRDGASDRLQAVELVLRIVDLLLKASHVLDERNDAHHTLAKVEKSKDGLSSPQGAPRGSSGGLQQLYGLKR